jgi:hypothetical protein
VPDPAIEHVYRTKGDLGDIRGAYDRSDALTRERFDLSMSNHRKTWDDMHLMRGPIAPGFGQRGGGVQLLLPMSVQDFMRLGLIEEVKVPSA